MPSEPCKAHPAAMAKGPSIHDGKDGTFKLRMWRYNPPATSFIDVYFVACMCQKVEIWFRIATQIIDLTAIQSFDRERDRKRGRALPAYQHLSFHQPPCPAKQCTTKLRLKTLRGTRAPTSFTTHARAGTVSRSVNPSCGTARTSRRVRVAV